MDEHYCLIQRMPRKNAGRIIIKILKFQDVSICDLNTNGVKTRDLGRKIALSLSKYLSNKSAEKSE